MVDESLMRLRDAELRQTVSRELQGAYYGLAIAQMRMGSTQLHQAVLGLKPVLTVRILPRNSIGVEYPT